VQLHVQGFRVPGSNTSQPKCGRHVQDFLELRKPIPIGGSARPSRNCAVMLNKPGREVTHGEIRGDLGRRVATICSEPRRLEGSNTTTKHTSIVGVSALSGSFFGDSTPRRLRLVYIAGSLPLAHVALPSTTGDLSEQVSGVEEKLSGLKVCLELLILLLCRGRCSREGIWACRNPWFFDVSGNWGCNRS
jgi:hypothetical protein